MYRVENDVKSVDIPEEFENDTLTIFLDKHGSLKLENLPNISITS